MRSRLRKETETTLTADLYQALRQRRQPRNGLQSSCRRLNTMAVQLWLLPAPALSAAVAVTCSVCHTPRRPPVSPPGSPQKLR